MKSYFVQDGIEFFQLQTISCVLFIFGSDVPGCPGFTAILVLCALHYNLDPVSASSHFIYALKIISLKKDSCATLESVTTNGFDKLFCIK